MVTFPPCKINLGLNIIARRPDGYHDLETCFYPVPWTDILEIVPADEFHFALTGLVLQGDVESNLCVKAFRLIQREHGIGNVSMHLHKILPSGAGLGGGSSDAACTLVMLNELFGLQLSTEVLKHYASTLGSDCAFFIEAKPMLGSGRGEVLTPVSIELKDVFIVLVKPDIHVSTAEAYAQVRPHLPVNRLADVLASDRGTWRDRLVNDFEESVFANHPDIARIKDTLYDRGAWYACMSGSGSTVFGLFSSPVDLKDLFPGMTCWSGMLTA
jgi:4-diphosphocytidyl-2-C-methyl-D-erythritol kinase